MTVLQPSATAPSAGRNYRYNVMPCLVSSEEVSAALSQDSIDTVATFDTVARMRNPTALMQARASAVRRFELDEGTSVSTSETYVKSKIKKFIDVGALARGTIGSEQIKQEERKTTSILSKIQQVILMHLQ